MEDDDETDDDYMSSPTELIIFGLYLLASIPIRKILNNFNNQIGAKLFIILLSIPLGLLNYFYLPAATYFSRTKIYSGYLFAILCPIVLFRVAYEIDLHIFFRSWHQVIIVSILRYIVDALMMSAVMGTIINADWIGTENFVFGFIIAPVSPFGSTDQMNELGKYKHIGVLLESEGMLNFVISHLWISTVTLILGNGIEGVNHIIGHMCKQSFGAILFGTVVGKLGSVVMRFLHNDPFNAVTFSFCLVFLSFQFTENIIDLNGPFTILVIGLFIGSERPKFSAEVDNCLINFWDSLFYMNDIWILFAVSSISVERVILYGTNHIQVYILTYCVGNITRFVTFMMFYPILSRIGYGLNVRCMLALAMASNKDTLNLLLANRLLYYQDGFQVGISCLSHITIYVLLSHVINNALLVSFLKMLGLTELSMTRKTNMDHCMKHILDKRDHYLSSLKTDRFLSDANWSTVQQLTLLKHPYKRELERDGVLEEWENRQAHCPDCQKVFYVEKTSKEKSIMRREAYLRILKSKKISFIRQFEHGMLSQDAIRILLQTIDVAVETTDAMINIQELFKLFTRNTTLTFIKNCITRHNAWHHVEIKPPRKYYRRILFNIISSVYFEIGMYTFIILSCVPVICELLLKFDRSSVEMLLINCSYLVVIVVYWIEFVVKILSYSWIFICRDGFTTYFRSFWNATDFIITAASTLDFFAMCVNYFLYGSTRYLTGDYNILIRIIRFSRLIRLLNIFRGVIPKLLNYMEDKMEIKLSLGFDVAKALVVAYDDVLEMLEQLVDDEDLQDEIKQKIETHKQLILKDIVKVSKDKPWIAMAVKTRECIRSTLNSFQEAIKSLKQSGYIDNIEFAKLNSSVNDNLKLVKNLKSIPPSAPKVLFQEVKWIDSNEEMFDFLFSNSELLTWDADEAIISEGELSKGIYILIDGVCNLSYIPKEGSSLEEIETNGRILIIDHLSTLRFDEKIDDAIIRGNTFGELSFLTDRPYDCKISTDINCKTYFIPAGVLYEALERFRDPVIGLEAKLWKFSTIHMVITILMEVPVYQLLSQNEIKLQLENSFVPDLTNYRVFFVIDVIKDIVLVNGKVMDYITREAYCAPSYIPRTVRKLVSTHFNSSQTLSSGLTGINAKLLIIPVHEVNEYEVMEKEEEMGELVDIFSSKCLVKDEVVKMKVESMKQRELKFNERKTAVIKMFGGLRANIPKTVIVIKDDEADMMDEGDKSKRKSSMFFLERRSHSSYEAGTVSTGQRTKVKIKIPDIE